MDKRTYPTTPDEKGFYYSSSEDAEMGILTKDHANGSRVKVLTLSDGREVTVRRLRGKDFVETKKLVQADSSLDFETVNMAQAVTVAGDKMPPEFFLHDLYQSDYAKLLVAYGTLNFMSDSEK